jgi:hypothetical protein
MNITNDDASITILDGLMKLIEKANIDFVLLNRMIYKVKNQYRRQKHFKYITQLKKMLNKYLFKDAINNISDNSTSIISVLKNISLLNDKNNIQDLLDLIFKIGCMIREMLKLKLYIPYSIVILGVLSRLHIIFEEILNNIEKYINILNKC